MGEPERDAVARLLAEAVNGALGAAGVGRMIYVHESAEVIQGYARRIEAVFSTPTQKDTKDG